MIVNLPLGFVNAVRAWAMIDGGSIRVRDCGCDRPQTVDNVGEICGEPEFRELEPNSPVASGSRPDSTRSLTDVLEVQEVAKAVSPSSIPEDHRYCVKTATSIGHVNMSPLLFDPRCSATGIVVNNSPVSPSEIVSVVPPTARS